MAHKCHAIDCDSHTPPKLFMCRRHWNMVPRAMQTQIWDTYRAGQENDKDVTVDYYIASFRARIKVAELEGLQEHKRYDMAQRCLKRFLDGVDKKEGELF